MRRRRVGNAIEVRRTAAAFSKNMLLVFADPPRAFHFTVQIGFRSTVVGGCVVGCI
jgi:hypothetical protein